VAEQRAPAVGHPLGVAILNGGENVELFRHPSVTLPSHSRRQGAISHRGLLLQGLSHCQQLVGRTYPYSHLLRLAHHRFLPWPICHEYIGMRLLWSKLRIRKSRYAGSIPALASVL
jgi:hypothetical protein